MACNPPQCLEIPPNQPGSTFCGWFVTWYRVWPITFPLEGGGLSYASLQNTLNNIRNAGGAVLSIKYYYLDSSGRCTLVVEYIFDSPGGPGNFGQNSICPPGFYFDVASETCICVGDPTCVGLCGQTGVLTLAQCNEACCVSVFPPPPGNGHKPPPPPPPGKKPPPQFDAPVPRGRIDLASEVLRPRSPTISRFPAGIGLENQVFTRERRARFYDVGPFVRAKNPANKGAPGPLLGGCGCSTGPDFEEEI